MFHDFHTFDLKVGLSNDFYSSLCGLSLELYGFIMAIITQMWILEVMRTSKLRWVMWDGYLEILMTSLLCFFPPLLYDIQQLFLNIGEINFCLSHATKYAKSRIGHYTGELRITIYQYSCTIQLNYSTIRSQMQGCSSWLGSKYSPIMPHFYVNWFICAVGSALCLSHLVNVTPLHLSNALQWI